MTGSVYWHDGPGCIIIIIDIIWVVLCDDILESDKESFIYFRDKTFFSYLTYCGLEQMDAILQTTIRMHFSQWKSSYFDSNWNNVCSQW